MPSGNGQLSPALSKRLNVSRTVDGARPRRRVIKNMRGPMLISADFDPRKRVNFGHGQGELLAVESHQRHAQRGVLGGGDDA
jgi:hypothetical protein